MAEPQNLANAAIIIATIYFWSSGAIGWIPCALLIIFGIATWGYWHQTDDQKKIIKLGVEEMEARIKNLNAATAIAIANTKIILGRIGQ